MMMVRVAELELWFQYTIANDKIGPLLMVDKSTRPQRTCAKRYLTRTRAVLLVQCVSKYHTD